jgi:hypothetical protein
MTRQTISTDRDIEGGFGRVRVVVRAAASQDTAHCAQSQTLAPANGATGYPRKQDKKCPEEANNVATPCDTCERSTVIVAFAGCMSVAGE